MRERAVLSEVRSFGLMKAPDQKFLNKLTVYVCVIAFVIVFASYILLPEGNMNSTLPNWVNIMK